MPFTLMSFTAEEEMEILQDAIKLGFLNELKKELRGYRQAEIELGPKLHYFVRFEYEGPLNCISYKLNRELDDFEYKIVGGYKMQHYSSYTFTITYNGQQVSNGSTGKYQAWYV